MPRSKGGKPSTSTSYTFEYDKKVGGKGEITVLGISEANALANAKQHCFTGKNFVLTTKVVAYTKPRKQGFAGSGRAN